MEPAVGAREGEIVVGLVVGASLGIPVGVVVGSSDGLSVGGRATGALVGAGKRRLRSGMGIVVGFGVGPGSVGAGNLETVNTWPVGRMVGTRVVNAGSSIGGFVMINNVPPTNSMP